MHKVTLPEEFPSKNISATKLSTVTQKQLATCFFNHSQQGIMITDENNLIVDINPACLKLTGFSEQNVIGKNPNIFSSGKHTSEFYDELWTSLKCFDYWQGDIWNRKKSGEIYLEQLTIITIRSEHGKLHNYIGIFSDITHIKHNEAELQKLAYNDHLTGLPNRLLLNDRLKQAIGYSERYEKLLAICYLDLDGFKLINDTYGHKAGDQVLIETAYRLQQCVRNGDTVSRLGGDEFVLLIQDLSTINELESIITRILKTITQPHASIAPDVAVSGSIGISLHPIDDSDTEILIRQADQAMYASKRRGKNCYSFFNFNEEQRSTTSHALQDELELALAEQQLQLFYQPKVNMKTGSVIGLEALIRWQHPEKGLLLPCTFLPTIQNNLLIIALGNWVLRHSLIQMRAWQAENIKLNISVNISAIQLSQPDFILSFKSLLNEFSDISPTRLELEIQETEALHDISKISSIMTECSKFGVNFVLDGFGTGYSCLHYLKTLPANIIKIDPGFISDLLYNTDDITMVRGILGMSNALQLTTIAEGVQSVTHGSLLLNLGCYLGQGSAIAEPMPAEDIANWLQSFNIAPEWAQTRGEYRTSDKEYSLLLMAIEHHQLVTQMLDSLEQRILIDLPEQMQDPHTCKFGRWLDNEGDNYFGQFPEFKHLYKNHQQLHEVYLQAYNTHKRNIDKSGNHLEDELQSTINILKELRHQILDSLHQLRYEAHDTYK